MADETQDDRRDGTAVPPKKRIVRTRTAGPHAPMQPPADGQDNVPFAWKQPLRFDDPKKMSRVLKTMAREEAERSKTLPARREE